MPCLLEKRDTKTNRQENNSTNLKQLEWSESLESKGLSGVTVLLSGVQ